MIAPMGDEPQHEEPTGELEPEEVVDTPEQEFVPESEPPSEDEESDESEDEEDQLYVLPVESFVTASVDSDIQDIIESMDVCDLVDFAEVINKVLEPTISSHSHQ